MYKQSASASVFMRAQCHLIITAPPPKILRVAARRAAPYEASTSINNNILKVSGWLTVSHFGTGFLMTQLGLGLVWLGLAAGAFVGIIAFSNGSAWFGLGLGLV